MHSVGTKRQDEQAATNGKWQANTADGHHRKFGRRTAKYSVIENTLYNLLNVSAINSYVSGRIFPDEPPENTCWPFTPTTVMRERFQLCRPLRRVLA